MSIEATIRARLADALAPSRLVVLNESHRHAGHAGDDGTGESHWHVIVEAADFGGRSRIERHRMVHDALGDVMGRIHALSLELSDGG